jgi:hypothetical protein
MTNYGIALLCLFIYIKMHQDGTNLESAKAGTLNL